MTFLNDNLTACGDIGYTLITILSAVAQAERAQILELTNEGRLAAMDKGIKFGCKPNKGSDHQDRGTSQRSNGNHCHYQRQSTDRLKAQQGAY